MTDFMSFEGKGLNRRQFLLGAAGLTAAAALAGCALQTKGDNTDMAATGDTAPAAVEADETVECDFVVAGAGIAGMAAAVQAVQSGCANVVLLEKNPEVGGSTAYAESIFANGSDYQKSCGYDPYDVKEMLAEELIWSNYILDAALFGEYMEGAPEYTQWLIDLGVKFDGMVDAGTGKYTAAIYAGGGSQAAKDMGQICLDHGVDLRCDSGATSLIMEGDKVVGIQAECDGKIIDFKAPTVCLATGGIATNEEMMDEYTRIDAGKWVTVGAPTGQDGDGIKMVEATAHGRAKHVTPQNMWLLVDGLGVLDPIHSIMGMEGTNLWVNQNAVRYVNEGWAQNFYSVANSFLNQGAAYSILDSEHVKQFETTGGTCFWSMWSKFMQPIEGAGMLLDEAADSSSVKLYKADTIEELAEAVGLDPQALAATVKEYNEACASGTDEKFGKDPQMMVPVATAPFYIAKLTNGVLNTMGGVRVDNNAAVLTPEGQVIEGLYAIGTVASGFAGEVYGLGAPGSNQGPAVYYGRKVGQLAAERK